MTQKITISVPDELHEKMQHWKDSFNYSGLFQDAISKEIQKKEDFQNRLKGDASMNEVIERLKEEKTESEAEYFDQGKTEGLEWGKASHYEEIQIALKFSNEWQGDKSPIDWFDFKADVWQGGWNEYWQEIMDNDPGLYAECGTNRNMDRFILGWIKGVKEFWNEVASKI